MSSAVEEFESSIISEAALSTEAFEFCDSEEDLELAKALEEYESEEGEPEAGFGLLGRADPFAVHAKGCALDARTREFGRVKSARRGPPDGNSLHEKDLPSSGARGGGGGGSAQLLPLRDVPPEVILKVLSCLSATDLSHLGQVSRSFLRVSSDNGLWRRLFFARWGHPGEDRLHSRMRWKALYFEFERSETEEILERSPIESAAIYIEMQKAKRCRVLGVCQHSELCNQEAETVVSQGIAAWLKNHGFPATPVPKPDGVPGPFVKIGSADAYVCERSGWVHVCDRDTCCERVVDVISGQLVCPVSGRIFERLLSTREEQKLMEDSRLDENNEDFSASGEAFYGEGYSRSGFKMRELSCDSYS